MLESRRTVGALRRESTAYRTFQRARPPLPFVPFLRCLLCPRHSPFAPPTRPQDPLASPARRIVGGDLTFPCHGGGAVANVAAASCDAGDISQLWDYDAATGVISSRAFAAADGVLEVVQCLKPDGSPVGVGKRGSSACGGTNQAWTRRPGGTVVNGASGTCLDVYDWTGPAVDTWTCNGGENQVR